MALQGNQAEEGRHVGQRGAAAEEDAQLDRLVGMMASLGLGVVEQGSSSAAAVVLPLAGEEVDSAYESRFWEEGAASAAPARLWGGHAAPRGRSVPAVHGRGVRDPYAYAPPLLPGTPSRGARRYEQLAVTLPARHGGVLPGGHAYMLPPPPPLPPFMHGGGAPAVNPPWNLEPFPSEHEQEVLLALSRRHPKDVVSYAGVLMESTDGQRLFRLVFTQCNLVLRERIVARITEDKNSFWRICAQKSREVVHMIENCGSWGSLLLLREAMLSWMTPNLIHPLLNNSNRIRVVLAFIKNSPRDIIQFIFEAVSQNCTRLACHPNGLSLLQHCLLFHGSQKETDDIFTEISYQSLHLSQNSCGNYIVQDVLKRGGPSHRAIIASCLRTNYVGLSRQKYSSNVVEQCLRVFDGSERYVIVDELISDPHFRELVTDEYANFVLLTALRTCDMHLRHMLATAIIFQNISYRNQHCLKIFGLLSKLGYEVNEKF